MIKCSVCINTFKRPFLLRKLLESLNNQVLDQDTMIEIIVVDNDPEKQAEPIVIQSMNYLKYPIYYYTQPEQNISLTRNVAVKNSNGYFLLFIDDDEYADIHWVNNLLQCIQFYNADAAFGKIIPYFNEMAPKWVVKWNLFARACAKTGEFPKFTYTGNCIVKAEVIKTIEGPFNPDYGITGGEDTLLFGILYRQGYNLITCEEAIVYDYFPPERATMSWILKRAFRTGNTYARRRIQLSENKIQSKLILFARATVALILYLLVMCFTFIFPRYFIFWLLKAVRKIGHLSALFNYHPIEYKKSSSEFSGLNGIRKRVTRNQK